MSFGRPDLTWLLLALPALMALGAWVDNRRRRLLERHEGAEKGAGFHRQPWSGSAQGPTARSPWLMGACGILVGAGAAGVQLGVEGPDRLSEPGEVILVLDVSRSMTVADHPPNRFEGARRIVSRAAMELPSARMGLVVFAGQAFTLLPPTWDRSLLSLYLSVLGPEWVRDQGSSLSEALKEASALGADRPGARSSTGGGSPGKVAILILSDGESHGDEEAVHGAVEEAADRGMRVHAISVGASQGGMIPIQTGQWGQAPFSSARPEFLEEIARRGHGSFAEAGDPRAVSALLANLDGGAPAEDSGSGEEGGDPKDLSLLCALLAFPMLLLERGYISRPGGSS